MNEHIKIDMNPEIIAKASPALKKIDAKAVAGVTHKDIIERNVIAKLKDADDGDEQDTDEREESGEQPVSDL